MGLCTFRQNIWDLLPHCSSHTSRVGLWWEHLFALTFIGSSLWLIFFLLTRGGLLANTQLKSNFSQPWFTLSMRVDRQPTYCSCQAPLSQHPAPVLRSTHYWNVFTMMSWESCGIPLSRPHLPWSSSSCVLVDCWLARIWVPGQWNGIPGIKWMPTNVFC